MNSLGRLLLALVLSALWYASQRVAWHGFYVGLAPVAGAILVAAAWLGERAAMRPSVRALATGALAGALMVLATPPLFHVAAGLSPRLVEWLRPLYAASRVHSYGVELPAFVAIVVAEEALWRGLTFEALRARIGVAGAVLLSTFVYGLAQLGTGSWLVVAAAWACGLVWTSLRAWSGSLWPGLVCHFAWTTVIVLAKPLV